MNIDQRISGYNPEDYTRLSRKECEDGRKTRLNFGEAESTFLFGGAYYSVALRNGSWVVKLEGTGFGSETSIKAVGNLMYNSSGVYVERLTPSSELQPIMTFGKPSSSTFVNCGVGSVIHYDNNIMKF